jgi:uncharacterized protein (TIGR02391 family)
VERGIEGGEVKVDRSKAIDLLRECLGEIAKLKERMYDNNPEFSLWHEKVDTILTKVFTLADYRKFARSWPDYGRLSHHDGQIEYLRLLQHYETALRSIIQKYEIREKLSSEKGITVSSPDISELPDQLFNLMRFHPKIVEASKSLFESKHYAQAIFEAFKAVENFVKKKSGSTLYGKQLMATVFNEDKPIIQVPEAGHFDKDVQEGFKFLFMGGTLGIRNPKAHDMVVQDDPFVTLEYLAFASLLLKRISFWSVKGAKS